MSSYSHGPSQHLYPGFDAYSQHPRPVPTLHYQQQPAHAVSGSLASGTGTTQNDSIPGGPSPVFDHDSHRGPATDDAFTQPANTIDVANDQHIWVPTGSIDATGWSRAVTDMPAWQPTTTNNAAVTPFTSDPLPQADSRTTQVNQNSTYGAYDYNIARNQYYDPSSNSGVQSPSYYGHTSIPPAPPRATEMPSSRLNHSPSYVMPQATSTGSDTSGQEVQRVLGVRTEQEGWFSINFRIPPVVRGSAQLDDGLFVEYYKEQDGTTVVHGRIPTDRNKSAFIHAHAHH